MNIRNVRWQNGVIAIAPDWEGPGKNFDQACYVPRRRPTHTADHTVAKRSVVTFVLVDLVNVHNDLCGRPEKIRETAAKFPGGPIVIRRRVLNISETNSGYAEHR